LLDQNFAEYFGELGRFDLDLPLWYNREPGLDLEIDPPENLDELVAASLRAMSPIVKQKLSLINSIIELKDVVTLKHTVERIKGIVLSLGRDVKFGPVWKTAQGVLGTRRTFRQILKSVADLHLQWRFNIAPMIADMQGIALAVSGLSKRLERELRLEGYPVIARYRQSFTEFDSFHESGYWFYVNTATPLWSGPYYTYTSITPTRTVQYADSSFHAQMRYTSEYSEFQRGFARSLSALDAVGANFNLNIVWNAIPWSFVIDWVLGVQDWLDKYTTGFMDPKVRVSEYLWSIKRAREIRVGGTVDYRPPPDHDVFTRRATFTYPTVYQTAYCRKVELPGAAAFESSGFSPSELSLGLSLLIGTTRLPRKKRHGPQRAHAVWIDRSNPGSPRVFRYTRSGHRRYI